MSTDVEAELRKLKGAIKGALVGILVPALVLSLIGTASSAATYYRSNGIRAVIGTFFVQLIFGTVMCLLPGGLVGALVGRMIAARK